MPRYLSTNGWAGRYALAGCIIALSPAIAAHAQTPPPVPIVEVAKAQLARIAPQRWVPGSVVSRDDAKLATSAAGRVEFVAEVGTRLNKGDRVAKLEDQAIRLHLEDARSEVARIKAQRELAERQSERLEKLAASRSIAANQVDEARAQVTQFAAQLRQAEVRVRSAEYDLDQTELRAPFPGVVSERLAQRGEFVATGAAIAHLVDITHLEARVQAPLALAAMVHPDMELATRSASGTAKARVRAVVPVGEERSRQFELRLTLTAAAALVGSAIEVALPERDVVETLAVPRDALVVRADGSYIVRVGGDGSSERISVRPGASDGELTAVEGALGAGDLVVVRGAERLTSGQKVQVAARAAVAAGATSTAAKPPG
ncbi:efflux RND transporter periplasmic adaptor subunit [Dokdonella soli]|uniref:Efflux RND transporter periplasmic adaptor subunit n=1 Tax=Dokdonella soli TaxID=529810 RepID=A0ABP3U5A7_9GAMM